MTSEDNLKVNNRDYMYKNKNTMSLNLSLMDQRINDSEIKIKNINNEFLK